VRWYCWPCMTIRPDTVAEHQERRRDSGWYRSGLYVRTMLFLAIVILVASQYLWSDTGDVTWVYVAIRVGIAAYAVLAAWWATSARRDGAPRRQRMLGAAAAVGFVVMCMVVTDLSYGIAHMGAI
jgi:hypothetical protein